jgi:hypothetical protein
VKRLILIFLFLPILINSQVYTAGTIYPNYTDITPDSLLYYIFSGPSGGNTGSFAIDINYDSQNDYLIESYGAHSPAGGEGHIRIKSLNLKSFKRFSRIDTSISNTKMALPLQLGDSINSKISIWDTTKLYISRSVSGFPVGFKEITDWLNINDRYIGLMYADVCDTIYGWVKINCQRTGATVNCLIKDYSSKQITPTLTVTSSNSLICVNESTTLSVNGATSYTWSTGNNGSSIVITPTTTTNYTVNGTTMNGCNLNSVITQSVDACIGIKELNMDKIKIYPNPTLTFLNISSESKSFKNSEIEITNYLGQTVLKTEYSNTIDVSKLANGIYTLKIVSKDNQSYCSKFVKE